ncbi:MAG: F0F1 ATP synthase subunit delta [Actinomycetes bacterium]
MRGVSRHSFARGQERLESAARDLDAEGQRRLGGDLLAVARLLHRESRLRRVVSDPALPPERRAQLLGQFLTDRLSAPATQVAEELAGATWARPRDVVDAADALGAQALFASAERAGTLDDVEDELFRFSRILDREPRLRAALTDPGLPADLKRTMLEDLVGAKVRPVTLTLVLEVVLHARGRTIDRGLEEYSRMAAERRERLVARVYTVVPLSEEQQRRLADALAAQVGHQVHLNIEIDPDLLGGLTVRVGDQLFDGSIAHRLGEAHRRIAG